MFIECFNAQVWRKAPKSLYLGMDNIKIADFDAITCFNDGYQSRLNIFNELEFEPGFDTLEGLVELDREKVAAKGRPSLQKESTGLIMQKTI